MSDSEVILKPKITPKDAIARPSMYVVVLHNDPLTPRAFVVFALKRCFQKLESEAQKVMLEAHEEGHAVVAKFPRDVAEMKASRANEFSTKHGYVLLFTAEKEAQE